MAKHLEAPTVPQSVDILGPIVIAADNLSPTLNFQKSPSVGPED